MKNTLLILLLLIPALLKAQLETVKSIKTKPIHHVALDRAGYLYVLTADGVTRYDPDGDSLHSLLSPNITSFDPGNGVRMLTYDQKNQLYSVVSPSFQPILSSSVDPSFAIDPVLMCSSGNYDILILDRADWTLKKVDVRISKILTDFSIDTTQTPQPDLIFMREYQNFIFLLDRQAGIMVYNSIGQHLQTIEDTGINDFNFLGEDLYYFKDGSVYFVNLFTGQAQQQELGLSCRYVVLTDERLYAVNQGSIDIFRYTPLKTPETKD